MDQQYSADTTSGGVAVASAPNGIVAQPDRDRTRSAETTAFGGRGPDDQGGDLPSEPSPRDLHLQPTPLPAYTSQPPDGWIYWLSWGTIYAGDCRMENAKIHLYPDGMILFQAETISSDTEGSIFSSGVDVWIVKGIQFYDVFGHPVGHAVPRHWGMQMVWEGSRYPMSFWDAIPSVGPSGAAQIRSATMTYSC